VENSKPKILIIGNPTEEQLISIKAIAKERDVQVVVALEIIPPDIELTKIQNIEVSKPDMNMNRKRPYRDVNHRGRWFFPRGF
jgi:FKBP-type peptidyl-prolyl cis-trans isomerase (trigger factor)